MNQIPTPPFYSDAHASDWSFRPDQANLQGAAVDWAKKHGIPPSVKDRMNTHLLVIDGQKDFCFPQGSLFVGGRSGKGAIEDNQRLARFMYGNLGYITNMTFTMDTHFPFQIFFASFWEDADGNPANPYTLITTAEIREGKYFPNKAMTSWICGGNYSWLCKYVEHYCQTLENEGKYALYLWPYHCMLGDDGHALVGVLQEARLFHSFARNSPGLVEIKGGNFLSENYSVLRPEVLMRQDGLALAQKNTRFIKTLIEADNVIIAGQAASHCVKSTIDDLLSEIVAMDAELAKKIFVLEDCMSSVVVPGGPDYTDDAAAALDKFSKAGMNVVKSTDPIDKWNGFKM